MIYGYIADSQGNIDFLNDFQNIDCGYDQFIQQIDITPVLLSTGIPLFTQQSYSPIRSQKVESNLIGNTITQKIYTF